jgi:hypothetical protein
MKREMIKTDTDTALNIDRWILLKNGWEYYLEESDGDVAFGLVLGDENELGYVSLSELKPYIDIACTGNDLYGIMPAIGYEWKDEPRSTLYFRSY